MPKKNDDNEDDEEEVIIIDDLEDIHAKLRYISYWHYIFTNNNVVFKENNYQVDDKFKEEIDRLLPAKESLSILNDYIETYEGEMLIRAEQFNLLIKDLSVRICTNVLRMLSEKNIVLVSWDESMENFAFQVSPKYLDKDLMSPKSFLKKVYSLARKHLKLKDHYRSIKK